ncbi:MAG: DUF1697 domain-containing protein [Prolixibacteraceae bacterium]|jgi:uncharacterized protein (DUF1697 family)|nr:DUF1697 domain-containing protein [Prolixibacteraceae bacterium]
MITYISLLRGINVAGQRKIQMADLKESYLRCGFENVTTYVQSGNVIFMADKTSPDELIKIIESAIFLDFNYDVPVQVVTVLGLKKIFARNPFLKKGVTDITKLHVTFLEKEPDEELMKEIEVDPTSDDEFIRDGSTIYLHCPNGYGKSKLSNTFFETQLKVKATTRNWKSITKLVELSA